MKLQTSTGKALMLMYRVVPKTEWSEYVPIVYRAPPGRFYTCVNL